MKKVFALLLTLSLLLGAVSALAQDAYAPFPITEEDVSITMGRYTYLGRFENIGEMWKWKDYAEKTGVAVTFKEYPETGWQEIIQLELATGNLQDAYYQIGFSDNQMFEQTQAGNFIALDELIEAHAPNIKKMFEDHPSFRKALEMPDGKVYSLPFIERDVLTASARSYISVALLAETGLPVPATMDEMTAYLRKVKELHPDMAPLAMNGSMEMVVQLYQGAYGLGNRGLKGVQSYIDLGEDGKVRFIPTAPGYKAMMQQLAAWYAEGLINPESLSTIDVPRMRNLASEGQLGLFVWVMPSLATPNFSEYEQWIGITALEGPEGHRMMNWLDAPVRNPYSFVITKKNQHPVETIKWVDYFYSEEGYLYQKFGVEGVTYAQGEDGFYGFIGEAAEKQQENMLSYVLGNHGSGFPLHNNAPEWSDKAKKIAFDVSTRATDAERYRTPTEEDYMALVPEELWPTFAATPEEAEDLSVILSDMKPYILEAQDKFITGALNFEADWDTYVNNLNRMGAEQYVDIRQAQYERYSQE